MMPTRARTGSAAITSLATSPGCGWLRGREAVRRGGSGRCEPRLDSLGQERGQDPRQHVAGAGRRQPRSVGDADERALAGRGDDRVGALEQADGSEALGAALRRLEPVRVHPGGLLAEQARELARVRSQHGAAAPVARLELVQRVRVQHDAAARPPPAARRGAASPPARGRARGRSRARRPSPPPRARPPTSPSRARAGAPRRPAASARARRRRRSRHRRETPPRPRGRRLRSSRARRRRRAPRRPCTCCPAAAGAARPTGSPASRAAAPSRPARARSPRSSPRRCGRGPARSRGRP